MCWLTITKNAKGISIDYLIEDNDLIHARQVLGLVGHQYASLACQETENAAERNDFGSHFV